MNDVLDVALKGYLMYEVEEQENQQNSSLIENATYEKNKDEELLSSISNLTISHLYGINRLVTAASSIIALIISIRDSRSCNNVTALHKYAVQAVKHFAKKANDGNTPQKITLAAKYCLCTALDEVVLNSDWGTQSYWSTHSLLSIFHNETFGGERFFIITNFMAKEPTENVDFLELIYIILSLGFKGKYYKDSGIMIAEIRKKLLNIIQGAKNSPIPFLSQNTQPQLTPTHKLITNIPLWVICALYILLLLGTIFISSHALIDRTLPIYNTLTSIARS